MTNSIHVVLRFNQMCYWRNLLNNFNSIFFFYLSKKNSKHLSFLHFRQFINPFKTNHSQLILPLKKWQATSYRLFFYNVHEHACHILSFFIKLISTDWLFSLWHRYIMIKYNHFIHLFMNCYELYVNIRGI